MGQGTKTGQEQGKETSIVPGQGQPGTGPGQLGQEPQHQSERGLQPIPNRKEDNERHSDPVEQAEQNKKSKGPDDTAAAEQAGSNERGF